MDKDPIQIDSSLLRPVLRPREVDSHKGDYGHLLVVAGCQRMPGAAVLATGAALKSGCGLVTLHSTERALQAVINQYPSAMLSEDPGKTFSILPEDGIGRFDALAVGPGLDRKPVTREALGGLLQEAGNLAIPTVLDADALNLLSETQEWPDLVPRGSVLTPHAGELRRLLSWDSEEALHKTVAEICRRTESVFVLKGYRTDIFTPAGAHLVNTTGNPGMAKGGSGDVLTGLIGGLLARGFAPQDAAALGVWIHGYAGDFLTATTTAEAYNSRDLIDVLWAGFVALERDDEGLSPLARQSSKDCI